MVVPSYHYLGGPMVALLALGVIVLLCRWACSTAVQDRRAAQRRERGDYGLLVPVATARSAEDAERIRLRLQAAGIRCTVAHDAATGCRQVLVFRSDAGQAGELVHGG